MRRNFQPANLEKDPIDLPRYLITRENRAHADGISISKIWFKRLKDEPDSYVLIVWGLQCFFLNSAMIRVGFYCIRASGFHRFPHPSLFSKLQILHFRGFQELELKSERFRVCEALFEPTHCYSGQRVVLVVFLEGDGKGDGRPFRVNGAGMNMMKAGVFWDG